MGFINTMIQKHKKEQLKVMSVLVILDNILIFMILSKNFNILIKVLYLPVNK